MEKKTTVRTDLDENVIVALDKIALELRINRRDRRLGVGTVAAELLTRLVMEHPSLIGEILSDIAPPVAHAPPPFVSKRKTG